MPGMVTCLSALKASGWAAHSYLSEFHVLVHVVHEARIIRSALADQPVPPGEKEFSGNRFNIGLSDLQLTEAQISKLRFLVGETDEYLPVTSQLALSSGEAAGVVTIEDIIYANAHRHWVTGATYIEAEKAGVSDVDIIGLLYHDLLGRPADPEGLANYVFQHRRGIRSFSDIRKALIESEEYRERSKRASEAPGAVFSQEIVMLSADPTVVEVEPVRATSLIARNPAPNHEVSQPNAVQAIEVPLFSEVSWPVYSERQVPSVTRTLDQSVTEELEVELPIDSILFGSGWHNVEWLDGMPFRWMEASALLFSPKPLLPCTSIVLNVSSIYGAHAPMLECYFDSAEAVVEVEGKESGFQITIHPKQDVARPCTKITIGSLASGCPLQDGRGNDTRVLSLNVVRVLISYLQETAMSREGC